MAERPTLAILVPMPTPKTILIIDDDDDLREALAEQLALHEAFRPMQAATAAEGVKLGRETRPAAKVLIDDKGKKVRLTEKETSILKYLYRAGAKAVSREELLTEVWGYNAGVTTHTLETHIYRLRQKIEPEPGQARLLLTDAGGYRLQP